jgi:anti-sigma B factor antagonist
MEIARGEESGVTVLEVKGTITLGESAKQFAATLQEALDSSPGGVVVELGGIDYVDSTGIGELVGYLQKFARSGRRLVLLHPHQRILALLKLTRLDTLFPIYQDKAKAVAFAGGAEA